MAVAILVGVTGLSIPNARGFLPTRGESFTNFDKRVQLSPQTAQAATLTSSQEPAANALRIAVPNARITSDKILGVPNFVTSARGFLTGPGGAGVSETFLSALPADDSHRVVKAFLNQYSTLFGFGAQALDGARIQRDSVGQNNGLHTTVWEQTVDGIPVFDGLLIAHVTRDGQLISISTHFVPQATQAADSGTPERQTLENAPAISASSAVINAAANVNVAIGENSLSVTDSTPGAEKKQILRGAEIVGDNYAQLVWLPMNENSMRLCWRVILTTRTPLDRFTFLVDAQTGEVLLRRDMAEHITDATYNVYTSDSPSPFTPGWPTPQSDQPPYVDRRMVTLGAFDSNASPIGWVGEENSPRTTGNNAAAFLDRNFDGIPDVPLPVASNRVFNFMLDLSNNPTSYQSASTVQLFYDANLYHDRLYEFGFDEQSGNYQVTNFARGGFERDPVQCLVQAGADVGQTDNSEFLPAPDGLTAYCAMFVFTGPVPQRDGSLDQEVVFHELTHGVSTRLVGGGVGIFQVQSAGMGEGWSDFVALSLLSEPNDDVDAVYPMGGYVTFDLFGFDFSENYYYGIRRYPYTTDMSKNPLTFKDIDPGQADPHQGVPVNALIAGNPADEVHNEGEVWCVTLWDMRANLVNAWGWEKGNQLALQLVIDGMKLAPPNPTFLEARDAIIKADETDNLGENFAQIWLAFAKRGMGFSATSPTSDTTSGLQEAYDLPPGVAPDGILEVRVSPPSGDILFQGDTNTFLIRVTDTLPVTNATIVTTTSTGDTLEFHNDGVAPDDKADNDIYSASLVIPTNQTSITITNIISAPDEETTTNILSYLIFVPPPNDDFSKAIKVPAAGTNYFTSNRRATSEFGEPSHAGIASATPSLWWNYTPTANVNLLVDAGGSSARTVIAVYTNNTLSTLRPVVSAVGSAQRPGPFVDFNAKVGITYHIAVAGHDPANVGVINLNIAPEGDADTNAPVVTIFSPLDGVIVTSNQVMVSGLAVDPGSDPSGVDSIAISVSSALSANLLSHSSGSALIKGPVATNWSNLVALAPGQNTIQIFATDVVGNRSAAAVVHVTYRQNDPPNNFFVNSIVLTNNSGVSSVNTINATKEPGEPNHGGSVGGKSAWWTFTAPSDGLLMLNTSNSTFDTVLGLYTGNSVSQLTTIAENDDAYDGAPGGFSEIDQAVRSNQNYRIAVDGYDGLSGMVFLNYSFIAGPIYRVSVSSGTGGTASPTSSDVLSNGVIVLTATPNQNYQFDSWTGDVISTENPLSLVVTQNMNVTAQFRPVEFTDGFESGNLQHIAWTSSGTPWTVQTNVVFVGQYAAKSGAILDGQTSSLIYTGKFRDGNGAFDYRVSSEANFDFLKFFVDGTLRNQWSGEAGWANFSFPISAGTHTLEWRYVKDAVGKAGLDAAFIDDVNLPLGVPIDESSRATLQLQPQSDGSFLLNLTGQTNQQYIVQTSTNLFDWQNISTNTLSQGYLQLVEPAGITNSAQFYRAIVAP
ncbi:MAG TPA: M36 family metallopeptidase [Verrucomicrobiae bacterium]|nr:M36 family metallopeptidase [Verrucomicrobiae bacterium]